MEVITPYEQFVYQMEKIGLRKEFTILEEKDATISEDDEIIYITVPTIEDKCRAISIRGIKETVVKKRMVTRPYYISIKIYTYGGQEANPEDTIQFSITEFKKIGLKVATDVSSHIVYYHYPYKVASDRLRFKKGMIITRDRRLEIRISRNSIPLKIGKIEIRLECDKWYAK